MRKILIKPIKQRLKYLQNLVFLYNNNILIKNEISIYNVSKVKNYFSSNTNKNLHIIQSGVYTNAENHTFGNFFLEIIDPVHRVLNKYKLEWDQTNNKEDFFIFLEKYKNKTDIIRTSFLNNYNLIKNQVYIKNGMLFFLKNNNYIPINTGSEKFLFTINKNYKIYCFRETDIHHHISSTRGKPVFCAADVSIDNGYLKSLNIDTGHYLIKYDKIQNIIYLLQDLGIFFNKNLKIEFFTYDNARHKMILSDFINQYFV